MTGIILAGGKNSRMGQKKAFIEINGIAIVDIILNIFQNLFSEIIIVTNTPEDFKYTKARLVKDIMPGKGPLGGLYTGIKAAAFDRCFVTACDMPYINLQLIKHIIQIKGYDVVVPKVNSKFEPLFAVYSKNCLNTIEKNLSEERLRILDIFSEIKVKEIYEDEMRLYDSKLLSLINLNTPGQLNSII
jgi:molybdopterin-guanine dinucleotide biosynthesis protein A